MSLHPYHANVTFGCEASRIGNGELRNRQKDPLRILPAIMCWKIDWEERNRYRTMHQNNRMALQIKART